MARHGDAKPLVRGDAAEQRGGDPGRRHIDHGSPLGAKVVRQRIVEVRLARAAGPVHEEAAGPWLFGLDGGQVEELKEMGMM